MIYILTSHLLSIFNIAYYLLFTYLALLGLHCYVGIFLVAEWGLLFTEVHGLLIVAVSLIVEQRL